MPLAAHETWIVIPAFDESRVIAGVLQEVLACGYSVVVVDDCSTDDTWARAADLPVHVCRHAVNLGQGAALQTGIRYALEHGARHIVTFDADGQHRPEDIPSLLRPLEDGVADVTLGTRFSGGGRAVDMPAAKRRLLKVAILFTRAVLRVRVTDAHNGLRAFTRDAAARIRITQNRMAHATQIVSQIRAAGLRLVEVPVTVSYSPYSLEKGQKMTNAFNILWDSFVELFKP